MARIVGTAPACRQTLPWGDRGDLNPRPPGPQPGALTELSYGHQRGPRQSAIPVVTGVNPLSGRLLETVSEGNGSCRPPNPQRKPSWPDEPARSPPAKWSATRNAPGALKRCRARAKHVMPLGVASSFQFYDPHPVVAARAHGSWLEDVDGNHYVDFNMGYGALLAGHSHPVMVAAIQSSSPRARCSSRRRELEHGGGRAAARSLRVAAMAFHELRHRGDDGRHPRRARRSPAATRS